MKTRLIGMIACMLMMMTGAVLAGGGDWKMGPFGPYWEDNEWPEFTPMYWMEEFMNKLDDDDDEINDWMRRNLNQTPNAGNGSNMMPGNAFPGQGFPGQAFPGQGFPGQAFPGQPYPGGGMPYSNEPYSNAPYSGLPFSNMPFSGGDLWDGPDGSNNSPFGRPDSMMPWRGTDNPIRRAAPRAPDYRNQPLPKLTPDEFKRMPPQLQREYERAFMQKYYPDQLQKRQDRPRNMRRGQPRPGRDYQPRRRSKKSACFLG